MRRLTLIPVNAHRLTGLYCNPLQKQTVEQGSMDWFEELLKSCVSVSLKSTVVH